MTKATPEQQLKWQEDGFLVARDLIPPGIVQSLVAAIGQIVDRAIAGDFNNPPFRWIDEKSRIPDVVNDLLTRSKYAPAFGELFDDVTLPFVESLLDAPVRCSWLTLFSSGCSQPYSTPVHRDNNGLGTKEEAELNERYRMKQCYFQTPLLPNDSFLHLVPRSHLRMATAGEIAASACGWDGETLPGLTTITLQPGDVVFRHTNTLHRGWNPKGLPRSTLISSMWRADEPLLEIEMQDYQGLNAPDFLARLSPHIGEAVRRYIDAYEAIQGVGSN
jgi:hypothetical protein